MYILYFLALILHQLAVFCVLSPTFGTQNFSCSHACDKTKKTSMAKITAVGEYLVLNNTFSKVNQIGCQNFCTVAKQDCSYMEKKKTEHVFAS